MNAVMKSIALLSGFLCASAFGAPATETVMIQKFAFAPREIKVAPGSTVTWTNKDETPHTLSANDHTFVSKALDTDDHFEHTFVTEGDFSYFCTLHPFMTGVVHVRAGTGAAGAR